MNTNTRNNNVQVIIWEEQRQHQNEKRHKPARVAQFQFEATSSIAIPCLHAQSSTEEPV